MKQQQIEVLGEFYDYSKKLIPAVETVISELKGNRQEDTEEFLNMVIHGINWTIEVLNHTMDIINAGEAIIDKEQINEGILGLERAIREKDDNGAAEVLKDKILPFLLVLNARAAVITNQLLN
ncbi:hypothetical protein [Anaerocolumna xylanovorans]|uniref:DUF8042 domain-containing protein n=1 Tax=Anaerocolumna xylanovorans DSM 12503 TaxID=1121345 RepID=A0A1M7Y839_9FIRM|nr:hypothetical protein [Anaerocolumna xylanovorans]SHO48805.1 hypothetical protein SAMN02745217_02043 [Anaerocolumna xylanovorans DSM 12503]